MFAFLVVTAAHSLRVVSGGDTTRVDEISRIPYNCFLLVNTGSCKYAWTVLYERNLCTDNKAALSYHKTKDFALAFPADTKTFRDLRESCLGQMKHEFILYVLSRYLSCHFCLLHCIRHTVTFWPGGRGKVNFLPEKIYASAENGMQTHSNSMWNKNVHNFHIAWNCYDSKN